MSPIQATSSTIPVIVNGYYGYRNLGDEAILESIIQWFASRDDVHPVVMSSNPAGTAKTYGVDSFPRANLGHLLKRLPSSPVILQGGGGLLQDVTSSRSLAYYLSIQLAGFVTGRKVVIFGQGIGPLEGEFSPWFVGEFLSHCNLVILRDFKSYSFAQSRMPVNADIRLMADAALILEPSDADHVDDIFLQENLDLLGKPLFAFALKGSMKDKRQITSLARAIDIMQESLDCGIALFPFHHPSDIEYAEAIKSHLKEKEYCGIVKGEYSPAEVLGLIGKCDLVVGMRLHSLIFAANRGVPFVPVSYDPKIDEFSSEFSMKPAVHVPLIGPERLVEAVEDAWEFRGRIKTRITQGMVKLQKRTSDGFNALGEYFDRLGLRKLGITRTARKRVQKIER